MGSKRIFTSFRGGCAVFALLPSMAPLLLGQGSSTVVISQIYGGGGNSGATLKNDFIELLNRGTSPVNITGWSVQYASAAGSSWDRTLLNGTIGPGQYYLVQEYQGEGGTVALPGPDATGSINLSATSGKVALVANSSNLTTSAPTGSSIIDFVGYGDANFAEGKPAATLTNTTAAIRLSGGCTDTNNNQADFSIGSPIPRNGRSAVNLCGGPAPQRPQITQVLNAASAAAGAVAPGEIVTISGSNFGLSSRVPMQLTQDGKHATTSLASLRVLFDGLPAPLLYVAPNEISAVTPFEISGRNSTAVQVDYNGLLSNTLNIPVAATAPGIYTVNSSTKASVVNEDSTANSAANPAAMGSVVTINATGCGQTIPDGDDGLIVGTQVPKLRLPVSAMIAGVDAAMVDAGDIPGTISGMVQIKVTVPSGLVAGGPLPLVIVIGGISSQSGVTIAVAGPPPQVDINSLIEEKLRQLKTDPTLVPLPEIPNDRTQIPADWLALISWNTQVGGTSVAPDAPRPPMVQAALSSLFSGTYQLLAAQEIPNSDSANLLQTMLPGGTAIWQNSFFDTTDTMDNGFWYRTGITIRDSFPLFVTDQTDDSGRIVTDKTRAVHPPQVAQVEIGDLDFTLVTVHLTIADGDTSESARELRGVLDYLDWYFTQPDHDPDVIVCGDFNMPSALSGQTGRGGITVDSVFDQDRRFQFGERRFAVTVHEPTTRSSAETGGLPVSNYDHCLFSASTMKEFIQARRVSTDILTDNPEDPEVRLTSDHFPVVAFLKTHGDGIVLDRKPLIRPQAVPQIFAREPLAPVNQQRD